MVIVRVQAELVSGLSCKAPHCEGSSLTRGHSWHRAAHALVQSRRFKSGRSLASRACNQLGSLPLIVEVAVLCCLSRSVDKVHRVSTDFAPTVGCRRSQTAHVNCASERGQVRAVCNVRAVHHVRGRALAAALPVCALRLRERPLWRLRVRAVRPGRRLRQVRGVRILY